MTVKTAIIENNIRSWWSNDDISSSVPYELYEKSMVSLRASTKS